MAPAPGIHMPHLNQLWKDQLLHHACLVAQMLPVLFPGVFFEDQVDDLLGIGHGMGPALEGCFPELFHPFGVFFYLRARCEQAVAVKVHAVCPGQDDPRRDPLLFKVPWLVGEVCGDRLCFPLDKVAEVVGLVHARELVGADVLVLEYREDVRVLLARQDHHPFSHEVLGGGDPRIPPGEEDGGGVLEDGGKGHEIVALGPVKEQFHAGDPVLGAPGVHLFPGKAPLAPLGDGHVKPYVPVKSPGKGRVIAGELELVLPGELKGDPRIFPGMDRYCRKEQ